MGIVGANGQPIDPIVRVVVEFQPSTDQLRVVLSQPLPPEAVVNILCGGVNAIVGQLAQARQQQASGLVVPTLVPPGGIGGA